VPLVRNREIALGVGVARGSLRQTVENRVGGPIIDHGHRQIADDLAQVSGLKQIDCLRTLAGAGPLVRCGLVILGGIGMMQLGGGVVAACRGQFRDLHAMFRDRSGFAIDRLCQQTIRVVEPPGLRRLPRLTNEIDRPGVLGGEGRVIVLLALVVARDFRHRGGDLLGLDILHGQNAQENKHLLFGCLGLDRQFLGALFRVVSRRCFGFKVGQRVRDCFHVGRVATVDIQCAVRHVATHRDTAVGRRVVERGGSAGVCGQQNRDNRWTEPSRDPDHFVVQALTVLPETLPLIATPQWSAVTLPIDKPPATQATMPSAPIPNDPMAKNRRSGPRWSRGNKDVRSTMGRTISTTEPIAIPPRPAIFPSDSRANRSMRFSLYRCSIFACPSDDRVPRHCRSKLCDKRSRDCQGETMASRGWGCPFDWRGVWVWVTLRDKVCIRFLD